MGIDRHAYNFLKFCTKKSVLGKTLTLGRQGNHLFWKNPKTELIDKYCEDMLINKFNALSVQSIDNSNYENATFVQDLNKSWDNDELANQKFNTIIDAGTMEHVFNVPKVLESVAKYCKVGGQIIHIQHYGDYCGHGFYQFSSDLFYSWYSKRKWLFKC